MKKRIAFILVALMVIMAIIPAFAESCGAGDCNGYVTYRYTPWAFAFTRTTLDHGIIITKYYDSRTVTRVCSRNSNHNRTMTQIRLTRTEYSPIFDD